MLKLTSRYCLLVLFSSVISGCTIYSYPMPSNYMPANDVTLASQQLDNPSAVNVNPASQPLNPPDFTPAEKVMIKHAMGFNPLSQPVTPASKPLNTKEEELKKNLFNTTS